MYLNGIMKQLKIWNGRCYSHPINKNELWKNRKQKETPHIFVCAHSMADAARVCEQYFAQPPSRNEMKEYWSPNCWGNSMDGITPERGLWIQFRSEKPVRVV